ncbi:MAG: hypothetical protein ACJ8AT_06210 [Hyalangium sp.]|uniref:hypothetical protein n=1 Tax=Hyalangium sp. TaxID=2028555 RepID=UPI00389B1AA2
MPTALDMTTVATAAARLSLTSSDASLPGLITAASSALAQYVGYPLERRGGAEETVVGQGGRYLWLQSGAIQSLSSIVIGGRMVEASAYALDGRDGARKGRIVARGTHCWPFTGEWTSGISSTPYRPYDTGEIIVTFTAGWVTPGQVALGTYSTSDMPPELEQAALEVVTAWRAGMGKDGRVTGMSTGDASMTWDTVQLQAALPALAQALAAPYRKPRR